MVLESNLFPSVSGHVVASFLQSKAVFDPDGMFGVPSGPFPPFRSVRRQKESSVFEPSMMVSALGAVGVLSQLVSVRCVAAA